MDSVTDSLCCLGRRFFARDITTRRLWLLEAALLAIALSFGLFGLDRSPTVWYDETFYNEPAYQLAFRGKLISGLEPGVALRDEVFLYPPLHIVFQAFVFRILGVGIWQVRLTCLFFHLLAGLLIFLAAKEYWRYGVAGLTSSALFLFDPAIVKSWRSGRPDALAVFLGILALYILIRMLRRSSMRSQLALPLYVLAGTAAGLSCITHPNCLTFALAGVIFLLFGLTSWRERIVATFLYGIGGILGVGPWGVFILMHLDAFAQQYLTLSAMNTGATNFTQGLVDQMGQLTRYYRLFPFLLLAHIVGLIWGLRSPEFRVISFASCWAWFLYFGLLHSSHPLPYVLPITALGTGGLAAFYISKLSKIQTRFCAVLVLLAFVTFLSCLSVPSLRAFAVVWQWEGRSHSAFANEWRNKIHPGASVAAPPLCFYAALANNNVYRYHRIVVQIVGNESQHDFRYRLIEDDIEYLVLPADARLQEYLLDEHTHLFRYVDKIRRPMRHLAGIDVGSYDFDIYRRSFENVNETHR